MRLFVVTVIFAAVLVTAGPAGANDNNPASRKQEIRFYKANRQLQTDLIWFTKKKGRLPGCHNFLKKTRVYIAKQIGFKSCVLYAKKNCMDESIVSVNRNKDETPRVELSEGYTWRPISEHKRGASVRSWSCK